MSRTAHERRFGERALRELLGEEHGQCHASECEAGQQVARRAGRADAVHDRERRAKRGERRQADVSGSVYERYIGGEPPLSEGLPQGPGPLEARVADRQFPHAEAAGLEAAHQRLMGDDGRRRVAAAGEPVPKDSEDIARAPPGPARRDEGDPQRAEFAAGACHSIPHSALRIPHFYS